MRLKPNHLPLAHRIPGERTPIHKLLQILAVLFIETAAGGQTRLSSEGYIEGSPELIVEIAASGAAIDTGVKKQVYCRNGVLEYIVWQGLWLAVPALLSNQMVQVLEVLQAGLQSAEHGVFVEQMGKVRQRIFQP